jgi:hypothetical protein
MPRRGTRLSSPFRVKFGMSRPLRQRIFVQMVVWRKAGDPLQSAKKRDQWVRGWLTRGKARPNPLTQTLAQPPCSAQQKPRGVGKKPSYSWWWCEVLATQVLFPSSLCQPRRQDQGRAREATTARAIYDSCPTQIKRKGKKSKNNLQPILHGHARLLLPSSMSSSNGSCVAGAIGDRQSDKYRPPPLTSRYRARQANDSGRRYSHKGTPAMGSCVPRPSLCIHASDGVFCSFSLSHPPRWPTTDGSRKEQHGATKAGGGLCGPSLSTSYHTRLLRERTHDLC